MDNSISVSQEIKSLDNGIERKLWPKLTLLQTFCVHGGLEQQSQNRGGHPSVAEMKH
jgi:hypothetical protein